MDGVRAETFQFLGGGLELEKGIAMGGGTANKVFGVMVTS